MIKVQFAFTFWTGVKFRVKVTFFRIVFTQLVDDYNGTCQGVVRMDKHKDLSDFDMD